MQGYEYRSEFARKYYGQGREEGQEEGREEGLQRAIIVLASSRFAMSSAQLAEKLRGVTDLEVLERLIASLGQARTDAEARAALEAIVGSLS
jgi:hypothetical protein